MSRKLSPSPRFIYAGGVMAATLLVLAALLIALTATASADGPPDGRAAAGASRTVSTISLPNQGGLEPYAMAYNALNGYIYVTNNNTNDVSVIDGSSIIARVSVGADPRSIVYNAGNNLLYVANKTSDSVSLISGTSNVGEVTVGNRPSHLTYNPKNNYIYVANTLSDTVTVIDGSSVVATVPVGNHPSVLVVNTQPASPNYGDVYVTNLLSDTVSIIGGTSGTVVQATLPLGGIRPTDLTFNPNSGYVYVVNTYANALTSQGSVTVIDSATRTVKRTFTVNTRPTSITSDLGNENAYVLNTGGDSLNVLRRSGRALPQSYFKVGNYPRRVRVDPVTHMVYVANAYSDTVTVLDGNAPDSTITVTVAGTVNVGDAPQAIQIDPTNHNVYVGNRGGNTISVLNGTSLVSTIPAQYYPNHITINPNNGYTYVPMRGGNVVRIYNGTSLVQEVAVRHNPRYVAINPATNTAYVANFDSNSLSVIDAAYIQIARISLGQKGPIFVTFDTGKNLVYAANWYSDTVSVVDAATNSVLGAVPVGKNPRYIAIDPTSGYAYVANTYGNTVSVLSGTTVMGTLAGGQEPRFALYNPANGNVYVSNKTDGTVSVFNGLGKLTDVTVGTQPEDMAVDGAGRVYVSNYGSNSVSIIEGTTVAATVPVGQGPEGIEAGSSGQVFVVNSLDNTVSLIEGEAVAATYPVGTEPRSLAYDALSDSVYVSNYEGASISLLSSQTPRVDFSGTPRHHTTTPATVTFTSIVTGAVTGYSWDFGDGGTSSAANPTHVYASPGNYGVSLSVSGPGGTGVASKVGYIFVDAPPAPPAPQANFSADVLSGTAPLTVTFTSVVTNDVTGYSWNFGDGGTSSAANPTHVYASPGNYGVSLSVSGPGGTDVVSKTSYILVSDGVGSPQANFSADVRSGTTPLTVTFTAVTTNSVTGWQWNFGDGGAATTGPVVTHTYAISGQFEVTLVVSNTNGQFVVNKPAYIDVHATGTNNPPPPPPLPGPEADFSADALNGTIPLTVTFTAVTTSTVDAWQWDFGDGGAATTGPVVTHTYAISGQFEVTLVVSNTTAGFTVNKPAYITVSPAASPQKYIFLPLVLK